MITASCRAWAVAAPKSCRTRRWRGRVQAPNTGWKDAPKGYGPHKTLYNHFMRWSRLGVFDRIFAGLASKGPTPERILIDATHLKAHRTAASLLK